LGFVPGPPGINPGPGGCITFSDTFPPVPELVHGTLDEDNVSWRTGVTWKPANRVMLYVNASQGYKAGGFPTLPATARIGI
jgi:iron complex outermembrane receptor protein